MRYETGREQSIVIGLLLFVFMQLLSSCGGGGGGGTGTAGNGVGPFTIGGTVSSLSGTVVLQNNGGDDLTVTANGPFTFATALADGSAYAVTVLTQPAGQTCTVSNGSGTIAGANITNAAVTCGSGTAGGASFSGFEFTLIVHGLFS